MTQPIRPGMFNRAAAEARKLEHSWIGPEHFLLALLAEPSPATDALAAVDVTYERFETHLRSLRYVSGQPLPAYDPERTLSLNPAAHDLRGLAKGFAIASGSSRRQPLHWLLAMIYMDHTPATHLDSLGVSARAILDALRQRGIAVPAVEPPTYRAWRQTHEIHIDEAELKPVLALLNERHPAGSEWQWGFNWLPGDPRRARIRAEQGVDLEAIRADAKSQPA